MADTGTCGIIVPRMEELHEYDLGVDGGVCIMPRHPQFAKHVFRTTDGKLIEWEDDNDCGCCEPDEDERCYRYREITEEDFAALKDENALLQAELDRLMA